MHHNLGFPYQVLVVHADVPDGDGEAENLLHLELDGGLQVVHLLLQVVVVGDQGGELARLHKQTFRNGYFQI